MGSKVREQGQANVSQSDEQGSKVRPEKGAQSRRPSEPGPDVVVGKEEDERCAAVICRGA